MAAGLSDVAIEDLKRERDDWLARQVGTPLVNDSSLGAAEFEAASRRSVRGGSAR